MENNKKKILIVQMSLKTGGTTSSLKALMQTPFSTENDIDILVICNNGNSKDAILEKYLIKPFTIAQLWYSDFSKATFLQKLAMMPFKILKQIPLLSGRINTAITKYIARKTEKRKLYDTVIAYSETVTPNIVQHFKASKKIAWIHCDYGKRVKREEEHIFKKMNSIVCVSDFTRDSFVKRYPILENKVVSIYNVCSIKDILSKAQEKIDDPRFDTSQFTVISVGRVDPVKRFSLIPSIAKKMQEAGCKFKWYIIGDGSKNEFEKVEHAIEANSISENVILLGRKTNPYTYFKAADLLVSTSESEACPMIFNEAKILGTPIVSANFGSAHEFIKQGVDGYISSIEEMHNTISKLIEDKDEYSILNPSIEKALQEDSIMAKINVII